MEEDMIKLLYKPLSILSGVLAGQLAGLMFRRIWKLAAREDEAPKATDAQRRWHEILAAAAVQGAVYGLVKAAVGRVTAEGTRKITGVWPGENAPEADEAARA
jgi:Protein of unknown function (DUF4235)